MASILPGLLLAVVVAMTSHMSQACDCDTMQDSIDLLDRQILESKVNSRVSLPFDELTDQCASGATPTVSLPLGLVSGQPAGVSGPARCALYCHDLDGCTSFNFLAKPAADGSQCQLFSKTVESCSASSDGSCRFFKMQGKYSGCASDESSSTDTKDSDVLVQQNIGNNSSIFARDWIDYKMGFGNPSSNYWIGLENLHLLTSTGRYRLEAVVQAASDGQTYRALFETFLVADESNGYRLTAGGYSGTAGSSNIDTKSNGMKFSTRDRDNDESVQYNCAASSAYGNGGGWWYKACDGAYINVPPGGGQNGPGWVGVPGWHITGSRLTLKQRY